MRKIRSFNENSNFQNLVDDIRIYLLSIGFNKSLLEKDKDFIHKIINKEITKSELLELLSEDEIRHINSMIRDSKIGEILR